MKFDMNWGKYSIAPI